MKLFIRKISFVALLATLANVAAFGMATDPVDRENVTPFNENNPLLLETAFDQGRVVAFSITRSPMLHNQSIREYVDQLLENPYNTFAMQYYNRLDDLVPRITNNPSYRELLEETPEQPDLSLLARAKAVHISSKKASIENKDFLNKLLSDPTISTQQQSEQALVLYSIVYAIRIAILYAPVMLTVHKDIQNKFNTFQQCIEYLQHVLSSYAFDSTTVMAMAYATVEGLCNLVGIAVISIALGLYGSVYIFYRIIEHTLDTFSITTSPLVILVTIELIIVMRYKYQEFFPDNLCLFFPIKFWQCILDSGINPDGSLNTIDRDLCSVINSSQFKDCFAKKIQSLHLHTSNPHTLLALQVSTHSSESLKKIVLRHDADDIFAQAIKNFDYHSGGRSISETCQRFLIALFDKNLFPKLQTVTFIEDETSQLSWYKEYRSLISEGTISADHPATITVKYN